MGIPVRPPLRIFQTGSFINEGTLRKQGLIRAGMMLCRCHEADGAVAMLMVVPMCQVRDPAPRGQHIFKRLDRQLGAVLQSPMNSDAGSY